ncbi:glycosyltransferase family 2 protein [Acinetobacter towneri]|uniref:glycosyltransferase family 2 protein n=1 Tax=Acinetobacter towneri TaxID=202956 RepID=UPI00209B625A|nr:glycosyltransferase family 2 protein [Acinetobacter towneri]MCO8056727.1 glycosyltransferase family 2 protein [Acinetobacter towneri]
MSKFISIGIPFYNAEKFFSDAIRSVLYQTYSNWELILIDDGSKDKSLEIANYFAKQDTRIRVISDGLNRKLPARLNQLIKESKGDFVVRMDADDVMHPQRLEKQLSFLEENKKYDLVASGLISIDSYNNVKGFRCVDQLFDEFSNPSLSYPIVHPSVMARKSWYLRNQYSEKYPRAEDFELWTRAITKKDFKMAVLPNLLLYYREEGNLSKDKIVNSYKDTLKIYANYYSNSFNIEVVKLYLKILIVNIMFYTGNLQKLANRRNKYFESDILKKDLQEILNKVIHAD